MISNMSSGLTIDTRLILGHSGAASITTPRIVTQPEIETEVSEEIPEIELLSSSSELSVELCDEYGRWPNSRRRNDKIMNTRVALFHLPQCQDHVVMDV